MAIKVVKWLILSREKRFFDQNDTEESKFRIKIVQKRRISHCFWRKNVEKQRQKCQKTSKSPKSCFWQLVESIPLSVISQNSANIFFLPFLMQISDLSASNCQENTLFKGKMEPNYGFGGPVLIFCRFGKRGVGR